MAEEAEQKSSVPLPPKLDLRRSGVLKENSAAGTSAAPAATPVGAQSSATIRIQLQDEVPTVKIVPAPASVSTPAAGGAAQARPTPTVEVKKPWGQPSPPPSTAVKPLAVTPPAAPTADEKPASKSETSRIPLELATPAANAVPGKPTGDVKTIKIKPSPAATAPKATAPSAEKPVDDKRKTSRISLEAALAMEDKGAAAGVPKTIRLKRPGEPTAKASPTLDTIKAASPDAKAVMSQTARLDEEAVEVEEGTSPTRRKTIKVRRPPERPGVKVMAGAGAEAATAGGAAEGEEEAEAGVGVFDWIAIAAATLTIIASVVVTIMLASQAWGPNPCLTELSSWKTGPDFAWTGKTQPLSQ